MGSQPLDRQNFDLVGPVLLSVHLASEAAGRFEGPRCEQPLDGVRAFDQQWGGRTPAIETGDFAGSFGSTSEPIWLGLSPWSKSSAKRLFDCACVLLAMPLLIPLILVIATLVWVTSQGPVLFMQKRMGRDGRNFTILKFRTMTHVVDSKHPPITTLDNQLFTPIGPFLRRWKLDELPQVVNVLLGQMSLVGPRPRLPEYANSDLPCRPGITGLATIVFATEETSFSRIPRDHLDAYYRTFVMPAKRKLDAEYMARATFFSDFQLLVNSVLRNWEIPSLRKFIASWAGSGQRTQNSFTISKPAPAIASRSIPLPVTPTIETEQL